tara:strand:+ start:252 stop:575 length:324 start_codon:yes stop_codon:yes gene_type:complete
MNNQEKLRLSECLWVDLKTHEQKRNFLLLGRGVDTGIIAPSMQNVLAHDYNIIVELKKDNADLKQKLLLRAKRINAAIDVIDSDSEDCKFEAVSILSGENDQALKEV